MVVGVVIGLVLLSLLALSIMLRRRCVQTQASKHVMKLVLSVNEQKTESISFTSNNDKTKTETKVFEEAKIKVKVKQQITSSPTVISTNCYKTSPAVKPDVTSDPPSESKAKTTWRLPKPKPEWKYLHQPDVSESVLSPPPRSQLNQSAPAYSNLPLNTLLNYQCANSDKVKLANVKFNLYNPNLPTLR